eukprot:gb/GECG01015468.1/.p1 GENE.gb/GECG01015468.1/~~gb/GECG01015468.1/.p1  ORF type:complete len:294 (+),score=14.49 gb/GECG01015468.1/:1-882(+)
MSNIRHANSTAVPQQYYYCPMLPSWDPKVRASRLNTVLWDASKDRNGRKAMKLIFYLVPVVLTARSILAQLSKPLDLSENLIQLTVEENAGARALSNSNCGIDVLRRHNCSGCSCEVISGRNTLVNCDCQGEVYLAFDSVEALREDTFQNQSEITSLRLHANSLRHIPDGSFDGLCNLTYLSLASGNLTSLPPNLFQDLKELKHLELRNNRLTELPEGLFDSLHMLESLQLQSNSIRRLPNFIFSELRNLEQLYLFSNEIEELPSFQNLESLEYLSVLKGLDISLSTMQEYAK